MPNFQIVETVPFADYMKMMQLRMQQSFGLNSVGNQHLANQSQLARIAGLHRRKPGFWIGRIPDFVETISILDEIHIAMRLPSVRDIIVHGRVTSFSKPDSVILSEAFGVMRSEGFTVSNGNTFQRQAVWKSNS